jgi:hypothetical protein
MPVEMPESSNVDEFNYECACSFCDKVMMHDIKFSRDGDNVPERRGYRNIVTRWLPRKFPFSTIATTGM